MNTISKRESTSQAPPRVIPKECTVYKNKDVCGTTFLIMEYKVQVTAFHTETNLGLAYELNYDISQSYVVV